LTKLNAAISRPKLSKKIIHGDIQNPSAIENLIYKKSCPKQAFNTYLREQNTLIKTLWTRRYYNLLGVDNNALKNSIKHFTLLPLPLQ